MASLEFSLCNVCLVATVASDFLRRHRMTLLVHSHLPIQCHSALKAECLNGDLLYLRQTLLARVTNFRMESISPVTGQVIHSNCVRCWFPAPSWILRREHSFQLWDVFRIQSTNNGFSRTALRLPGLQIVELCAAVSQSRSQGPSLDLDRSDSGL